MFYGCVHEGVLSFIEKICSPWKLSIDFCNLRILHHGYDPIVMQEKNKIQRNHDLLRKAIMDNPNEFYFHMQLGLELRRMGEKEESFQEYAYALRLAETIAIKKITPEVREMLLTQYSAFLAAERRFIEVIKVLTGVLAESGPLTASQLMVRARAYIQIKQPSKALEDAELAHSYRMNRTLFPSAINPQSLVLEAMMAEVLFLNRRYSEALEYFSFALKSKHPELRTVLSYAECLDAIGKTGEALGYLHNIIINKSNIAAIWIHGATLLLRHEELSAVAAEWIAEARVYHPDNTQIDLLVKRIIKNQKI
jgi:tetratricopeptide (TPR) repeat protein